MNKVLLILGLLALVLIISLRPIDTSKENSLIVFGKVVSVSEGGYKDAGFRLEGKKEFYYINRALVKHFKLAELKQLEGQWLSIRYANHWSVFGLFFTPGWHITELRQGDRILYSEFEK